MTPETALALVKKYAAQHGVRKAARIFKIGKTTVSDISRGSAKHSGKRIVAKVAAAGTFTCRGLGVLILPEVCLHYRELIDRHSWDGIPREIRKLYAACPGCPEGKALCKAK